MNKILKIIILSFVLALALSPIVIQAATFQFDGDGRVIEAIGGQVTTTDPEKITTNTMNWALGLLGLVAVIIIIFGGFTWMTAAGNEEKISKAKKILTYSVIGLVIIIFSLTLVNTIFDTSADISGLYYE